MNYSTGKQNIITNEYQVIRLSEGCPWKCPWCREWKEIGDNWQVFPIPEIVRHDVRITDMNLLAKKEALDYIRFFEQTRVNKKVVYPWLVCGIDYRFLTPEIAQALKDSRFVNMHIAWDRESKHYEKVKKAIEMLIHAGYKAKKISVFMICNHPEISYDQCMEKFYLCHEMGVKVNDCYYDNQYGRKEKIPIGWTHNEIKAFRKLVRKYNQILNFGIDPEK